MDDGRHVVVLTVQREAVTGFEAATIVKLVDLDGRSVRSWRLPAGWQLTRFGDDRHVVLEAYGQYYDLESPPRPEAALNGSFAIIDTEDTWVGYVPPIRP